MRIVVERLWDGSPARSEERVVLDVHRTPEGLVVHVDAPYHGNPEPPCDPGPTDGLWNYGVVELFLVGPEEERRAYTEIELGPHGHHLVLRLKLPQKRRRKPSQKRQQRQRKQQPSLRRLRRLH